VLGAWWSYEVLGWGGYWAWDPVENASLLPWLTAAAFIHSVMVQERRGMLRVWNLSLVIATFCLTILGTFLTRSGVINSVHAFTQSDIGPFLLVFLALCAAVGIGLIAWRGDRLRSPGRIDSPVSRESAFLVNNLLFAGLALVVLLGTVYPLLAEALQNKSVSVGEPYFDRMATPIGIALLFLMAVAPALPWRTTGADVLRKRLLVPAWAGVLTMLGALVAGARGFAELVTFGLAAFALAGIARQFFVGTRARRTAQREAWPRAAIGAVRGNPRLYGGLVVHVGIVLIAVAIATSGAYSSKQDVRLTKGQSATVSGYKFTYLGSVTHRSAQKTSIQARVRITHGGSDLGVYAPGISTFPNFNGGIGTPSIHTSVSRDIYLTLVSSPNQKGRVTIGVAVKPMIVWIWIGGGVVALGTLLALTPSLRRKRKPGAPALEPPPLEDVDLEEALPVGGSRSFLARNAGIFPVIRAKKAEDTA
jgi:cytochrome c-type biogenesis protein CcmF